MDNAENGGWLGQAVPLDTIYAQQSENKCKKHVEKTRVSDPHLDGSGFFRRSGSGPLKPGFIRFFFAVNIFKSFLLEFTVFSCFFHISGSDPDFFFTPDPNLDSGKQV